MTISHAVPRPATADAELGAPSVVASTFRATCGDLVRPEQLTVGSIAMHRLEREQLLDAVAATLSAPGDRPLALASVNLDHVFHFSVGGASLERSGVRTVDWLMVVDGAPVAKRASVLAGRRWPRLPGADLLPAMLTVAEQRGASVGFLGGADGIAPPLRKVLAERWPGLRVAGVWTPPRRVVDDPAASRQLALEMRRADVDLLFVGLGKPRQEAWIARHATTTGASVHAAFGAAADFLAGAAPRAPRWMRAAGLEWSYRLGREPRRLWRRYLQQGPIALSVLRHAPSRVVPATALPAQQLVNQHVA